MCGIAGWIHRSSSGISANVLDVMIDTLEHRGPDGRGVFHTSAMHDAYQVGLAHRRLAILDLSTGDQPMHSACGNYVIVFNGEIYNFSDLREELKAKGYHFVTQSDTEVLLSAYIAWGEECVSRLRGMFAFAIWDKSKQQLMLARDRFGKKPLFLWQGKNGQLVFASEIKAILKYPSVSASLDRASVLDYFQYRYTPGPNTLFQDINKLPPGHYAVYSNGQLAIKRYYQPPDAISREGAIPSRQEALQKFYALLDESVRIRMVSDVPYGAFLSGGLDSSSVVALMSQHSSHPVKTFSIGFDEDEFDERGYARIVADYFKTEHHEFSMPAKDIIDILPKAIMYRDGPVSEPTDVAVMLMSLHAAKHVKMVLTGEGADEILGGYPKHKFEPYSALYQTIVPAFVQSHVMSALAEKIGRHNIVTVINSFGLRNAQDRMPRWFGAFNKAERDELIAFSTQSREVCHSPFSESADNTALRKILYFDQTSWLPDNLLERGDRMTMAASLEARMPLMDHELAQFVSSCPDDYRIYKGNQKWLLRESMKGILPDIILTRRKVGFKVPVSLWFRTTLRECVRDHLQGSDSLTRSYYKAEKLEHYLSEHESGKRNHEKLVWALLNLELFQKQYRLN